MKCKSLDEVAGVTFGSKRDAQNLVKELLNLMENGITLMKVKTSDFLLPRVSEVE